MRLVVLTATLVTAWLVLPGAATAQDPPPVPTTQSTEPQPPPPSNVAVPRGERVTARAPEVREPARSADDGAAVRGAVRRPPPDEVRVRPNEDRKPREDANVGRRRPTAPPALATTSTSTADEEQRGAQRRGDVRRPPSGVATRGGPQASRDRAVPRASVPPPTTRVFVYPDYYRYYNRYYDPWGYGAFGLGYFYYSPWGWNPGYYGPGYAYGYGQYGGVDIGSVKLKVKPRDADVFVDGYYAGHVDDFDGIFQALKLDSGAYRIEIRKSGYETLQFDVRVQPERSITFRGELKPIP